MHHKTPKYPEESEPKFEIQRIIKTSNIEEITIDRIEIRSISDCGILYLDTKDLKGLYNEIGKFLKTIK